MSRQLAPTNNTNINTVVNITCICKQHMSKYSEDIYAIIPCNHLIHSRCIDKYITDGIKCPLCNTTIETMLSYTHLKDMLRRGNYNHYQNYIDITSIKNRSNYGTINYPQLLNRILPFFSILSDIPKIKSFKDVILLSRRVLDNNNIKIVINNEDKLLLNTPKVIIANHTTMFDSLIMLNKFKCGFIASTFINTLWYLKNAYKHVPLIMINKDDKNNSVSKMKEFLSKHDTLCIFPEGTVTHENTIIKFRTGAFYTDHPVQPIIMKYSKLPYSENTTKNICKMMSQDRITVTLNILDPIYPPFTPEKIEWVRDLMARQGNFAKSNISNRDIVEI